MKNSEPTLLTLNARDLKDLSVVSSMVQDALVPVGDFTFLRDERRFVLALNRFQWEDAGEAPPYSRTHAGLRFDKVLGVQFRKVDRNDRHRMLSLLAVVWAEGEAGEPDQVVLQFADGAAVRLKVEKLMCSLRDLGAPWPTQWIPGHGSPE